VTSAHVKVACPPQAKEVALTLRVQLVHVLPLMKTEEDEAGKEIRYEDFFGDEDEEEEDGEDGEGGMDDEDRMDQGE
jgi:hypothetical protein